VLIINGIAQRFMLVYAKDNINICKQRGLCFRKEIPYDYFVFFCDR
jgi:hypothetical protein